VDFSIEDAQDVFIYNKGYSIDPALVFQQKTKTININKLYFYSEVFTHAPLYNSLLECKEYYKQLSNTSKELNDICTILNEKDDIQIIENSFFNLFTYNEYMLDTYKTQKTQHYIDILKRNGFKITEIGTSSKISKDDNKLMKLVIDDIKDEIYNAFLESGITENEQLKNNLLILALDESIDKDIFIEYKDIITDKFETENHLNIIRLLKDEPYINNKLADQNKNTFNISSLNSSYNKIKLLIQLEKDMRLGRLDINFDKAEYFDMNDKRYQLIKKVFRISKATPTTKLLLFQLYITMIKNIGGTDIIISKQTGQKDNRTRIYNLNTDTIMKHIKLNKLKNPRLNNYDEDIITLLQLRKAEEAYPFDIDDSINLLDIGIK